MGEEELKATIADLERRLEASERSARALADSERLYRSLFEGMATAVTLRSLDDQSFIDCNAAALRLYRATSVDQLRGARVIDLSPEKQLDGSPSRDAFREHVARALASGTEHCEWLARRLDGTVFLCDVRIAVLQLEGGRRILQTIIDDITERKAAEKSRLETEQALRVSEERYRTVVERSHDAILVFDLEANVTFASPAAEPLMGYTARELLGMPAAHLIVADDHQRLAEGVAAGRVGLPQPPEEWTLVRKDGGTVRVEAVRSPMHDHSGKVIGGLVIVRDVSERHRAEQTRAETQRELARAKEDAIAASAAKSVFVANMSHELRTPLNGVIGMVDILSRTPLDGRQRRYVEVARTSASLLLSVINDILDFSKIEAGKLELEHVEFSFRDVVEEVATMLELSAEEKSLELCCATDAALDAPCTGDPARVRQILVNLISNAIKFTSSGEVTVQAKVNGETEGGRRVRVEVRDTGIGMTADAQEKLFRPFSQVDASAARQHGGTGLGLAICRQLVHRMGGEIGVVSSPGVGSTFWFTLRLDPAAGGERAADVDVRLAGVRVLAVDDNATNREILRAQLAAAGMLCEAAASGEEALAMLAAATQRGEPYALAILDQHMPGMDGCELARRIKADTRVAATRLVMLGSMGRPLDPEQLHALGIVTWATKPVWRIRLLRTLSAAIDDSPGNAARQARLPSPVLAEPAPEALSADGFHARVLLVEDTPINAEVVVEILRIAGYSIDVAVDGLAALGAVTRAPYDLVLMDCQLPGIDGYETTRRIRALEGSGRLGGEARASRLPILALTASATREDLERARLSGMDDHIAKPVDTRRLLDALAVHLGRRPDTRAPGEVAAAPGEPLVVDLGQALDRLQGNRGLLERMVAQFREEIAGTRRQLHECLEQRAGDALGFAVHRLRGQALGLDAGRLAIALGTLEGVVGRQQWDATARALQAVDRAIDEVVDALSRGDVRP